MFKGLAILFLFSTTTIIGFYQSGQLYRRKTLLTEFRDFLQKLETEMGYFKEPLPLILEKLHQGTNGPTDLLLRQCLLGLETAGESIKKIWRNAVKEAYENEPLNQADLAVLCKCGSFIGQSDYQGQKGHFDLLKQELERQIYDAAEKSRTKGPLYSKAGLSIGAVLSIALL